MINVRRQKGDSVNTSNDDRNKKKNQHRFRILFIKNVAENPTRDLPYLTYFSYFTFSRRTSEFPSGWEFFFRGQEKRREKAVAPTGFAATSLFMADLFRISAFLSRNVEGADFCHYSPKCPLLSRPTRY